MTINSNILSDRSRAIIETIRMRLTEKQSLEYLKEVGFEIGPATYYREKRKVEDLKLKRLYDIAKIGFQDQHLERIDQYEMGFKIMWENVLREKDPYKQNAMIKDILLLQPYLSSYYEATKLVLEKKPDYKNESNKEEQQQWQLQEEQDEDEKEEKELNGDSYTNYQQQQQESTTDDYYYYYYEENKNRKF